MSLTRRRFVEVASLALLSGAVIPAAFAQDGVEANEETFSAEHLLALSEASRNAFERLVGERFAIRNTKRALGYFTLLAVEPAPLSAAPSKNMVGRVPPAQPKSVSGFALRFRGSGGELAQGTYTFRNAALGSFPLFIVPAGPGVAPPTYTAVFSSLGESART